MDEVRTPTLELSAKRAIGEEIGPRADWPN
jgi:hypothetical protein